MKKYTYNQETLEFSEYKGTSPLMITWGILLIILVASSFIGRTQNIINNPVKTVVVSDIDSTPLTKENVWKFINEIEIRQPGPVYQQVMLETGDLKSKICLENHNLIGLRFQSKNYKQYCIEDFKPRGHLAFASWKLSLLHYKAFQNKYYHGGDYYDFLSRRGYAEAPDYVKQLKKIKIPK